LLGIERGDGGDFPELPLATVSFAASEITHIERTYFGGT
jgi:hypothetical protein